MELGNLSYRIEADTDKLQKGVDDAKQIVQNLNTKLQELDAAFRAGTLSQNDFKAATREFTAAIKDANEQIAMAQFGLVKTKGALGEVAGQSKLASMAAMELGRGMEDFIVTGGSFRSVINNASRGLEIYAMQSGMSAGKLMTLSLATTGVGIALDVLVNHWSELVEAFSGSHLETEAERMKRLGDETERTAAHTKEYVEWKMKQSDVEAIEKGRSKKEEKQAKAVREALAEGPGVDVEIALSRILSQENVGFTGEMTAEQTEAYKEKQKQIAANKKRAEEAKKEIGYDPGAEDRMLAYEQVADEQMRELEELRQEGITAFVKRMLGEATRDEQSLRKLVAFMSHGERAKQFVPAVLQGLKDALPEGMARKAKEKAAAKEAAKEATKRAREAEQAKKKIERDEEAHVAKDQAESQRRLQKRITHRRQRAFEALSGLRGSMVTQQARAAAMGTDPNEIRKQMRVQVVERLKARGTEETDIDAVADKLVNEFVTSFEHAMNAANPLTELSPAEAASVVIAKSEEARKAEQDRRKAEQAQAKADRLQSAEVKTSARRFHGNLEAPITYYLLGGMTPDQVMKNVVSFLHGRGVKGQLADNIAEYLVSTIQADIQAGNTKLQRQRGTTMMPHAGGAGHGSGVGAESGIGFGGMPGMGLGMPGFAPEAWMAPFLFGGAMQPGVRPKYNQRARARIAQARKFGPGERRVSKPTMFRGRQLEADENYYDRERIDDAFENDMINAKINGLDKNPNVMAWLKAHRQFIKLGGSRELFKELMGPIPIPKKKGRQIFPDEARRSARQDKLNKVVAAQDARKNQRLAAQKAELEKHLKLQAEKQAKRPKFMTEAQKRTKRRLDKAAQDLGSAVPLSEEEKKRQEELFERNSDTLRNAVPVGPPAPKVPTNNKSIANMMWFGTGPFGPPRMPGAEEGAGIEKDPVIESNKLLARAVDLLTDIKDKPNYGRLA